MLAKETPREVRLWQATNPEARDFRVETLGRKYTSTVVEADKDGLYRANVAKPAKGWTAYFLEMTYDVDAPKPLKLTTNVVVTPEIEPFKDKPSHLPTSVTLVCNAPSEEAAKKIVESTTELAKNQKIGGGELKTRVIGKRCFFNFTPHGDFRVSLKALAEQLTKQQCTALAYQLESGPEMTIPPAGVN